ncbi:hypothetical protein JCM10212_002439 [Sporobolomyces blumeae]
MNRSTRSTLATLAVLALVATRSVVASPALEPSLLPPPGPPRPDEPIVVHDGFPRLANTLGWMSIMAWILVYGEPIWMCFRQKSGDGLSLVFLVIWLVGDLTNLLGSFWQGLIPTVIILAVYYTACDCILIFQKFYYHRQRVLHPERYAPIPILDDDAAAAVAPTIGSDGRPVPAPLSENTPLLSAFSAHSPSEKALSPALQRAKDIMEYTIGFVLVAVVGIVAWFASNGVGKHGRVVEVWDTSAQVVGWVSAFLYLGSRLPQLALNRKTKCEGLSLLMFCFAVIGNVTYVASILLTSLSLQHLLVNAPWLLGSGGTIFLDFIVLGQFAFYAKERRLAEEAYAKATLGRDDDDSHGRSPGSAAVFVDEEREARRNRDVLGDEGDEA